MRSFLVTLVLVLAFIDVGVTSERSFDETGWTRGTWQDFKLELPVRVAQPSDEARLSSVKSVVEGCDFASIDGPGQRSLLPAKERVTSITVGNSAKATRAKVMSSEYQILPAAKAIKCEVCQTLVEDIHMTVQHVSDYSRIITEDSLLTLLKKSCDDKIVHLVLDTNAIIAIDLPASKAQTTGSKEVYQLQPRPQSLSVQAPEISAVSSACKSVLKDMDTHIAESLYMSLKELRKTQEEIMASGKGDTGDGCMDDNTQCAIWALRGECTKNPTYMLHHCRASCGVCKGPKASAFQDAQATSLQHMLQATCGELPHCMDTGRAEKGRGASLHQRVLENEKLRGQDGRGHSISIQQEEAGKAAEAGHLSIEELMEKDLGPLRDKCMWLNQGWWTYQVCYKDKIKQLHMENKRVVLENDLGSFNHELTKAHGQEHSLLAPMDLLPHMSEQLPYISHVFTGGSPCEKGSSLLREAELRIACGVPSGTASTGIQMKIREPRKCAYILVLYLPSLCKHPDFGPRGRNA